MCAIGSAQHVADRVSQYHEEGVDVAIILPISSRPGDPSVASNTYFSVAEELRKRRIISSKQIEV